MAVPIPEPILAKLLALTDDAGAHAWWTHRWLESNTVSPADLWQFGGDPGRARVVELTLFLEEDP